MLCDCFEKGKEHDYCRGTREKDWCNCGGDESKCDYYSYKKERAGMMTYEKVTEMIDSYLSEDTASEAWAQALLTCKQAFTHVENLKADREVGIRERETLQKHIAKLNVEIDNMKNAATITGRYVQAVESEFSQIKEKLKTARADAMRELADKLKEKATKYMNAGGVNVFEIDAAVDELVGD